MSSSSLTFTNGSSSSALAKTNGSNGSNGNHNGNQEKAVTTAATTATTQTTTQLSNAALEARAKDLQQQSAQLSSLLTQKLASSQSGQNLLHLGTSLSSLPPDLHSLLLNLHPLAAATESYEKQQESVRVELTGMYHTIRRHQQRTRSALAVAELYQDLVAAEGIVRRDANMRRAAYYGDHTNSSDKQLDDDEDSDDDDDNELDHAACLERAAHIALMLMEELERANQTILSSSTTATNNNGNSSSNNSNNNNSTEAEQFIAKLAPRIRRLEADVTTALKARMEQTLQQFGRQHNNNNNNNNNDSISQQEQLLMVLGHVMRGLAVTGHANVVESIFARTAILPMVRSKLSMGRLDQGGARGECAGLPQLLQEMQTEIAEQYGSVLQMAESMFAVVVAASDGSNNNKRVVMDVDLLTEGVWVPIATALMADAGLKMAIFSPGIASILQANYTTLDRFLSQLARRLLFEDDSDQQNNNKNKYYQPSVTQQHIQQAQDRIYAHPKTAEFAKKWNLPIYYQLRFGECCTRMNKAVDDTKREGWIANVYSGLQEESALRQATGFELSLFMELYDVLLSLWLPDVILRPLTNRFLRGSVQLVGRIVSFIDEGMQGRILFGDEPKDEEEMLSNGSAGAENAAPPPPPPSYPTRKPYCWGESEEDVAAVAWELTILDSTLRHDYTTVICDALSNCPVDSSESEQAELRELVLEVLKEASDQIHPVVDKAWNEIVVNILIEKCSAPLGAVKGVAATYRMTNRPPPTQASPFVATILRPLKEFDQEFANRTPDRIGNKWKQQVVVTLADRYAAAVEDLIATVQRTEVALKNRKARRMSAGGMSDGEKVKLQLYLDYQAFAEHVRNVGVEPATVIGLSKLSDLTAEGEKLLKRKENGA